jgi:REP element-mobilizing transposase RayT
MRGNYIDVYYHIVWPTKNREPYISELIERRLFSYLSILCSSMGVDIFAMNEMPAGARYMAWQPGYGLLTFAKRYLKYVVSYVNNQKQHHADSSLTIALERCSSEYNVPKGLSSNPNP